MGPAGALTHLPDVCPDWPGRLHRSSGNAVMSWPNIITVGRILTVPVIVWLIITGQMAVAFAAFIMAGVSDGADGYIAKKFNQQTDLGAYLDPLADKALLVSIYVSLGFLEHLPSWLVIAVVSRDILIIGAVLLSWVMNKPVTMAPLMISKLNTVAQIVLAAVALGALGLSLDLGTVVSIGAYTVVTLTVASGLAYLLEWLKHMANGSEHVDHAEKREAE